MTPLEKARKLNKKEEDLLTGGVLNEKRKKALEIAKMLSDENTTWVAQEFSDELYDGVNIMRNTMKPMVQEYMPENIKIHTKILPPRGKQKYDTLIKKGAIIFSKEKIKTGGWPKDFNKFY